MQTSRPPRTTGSPQNTDSPQNADRAASKGTRILGGRRVAVGPIVLALVGCLAAVVLLAWNQSPTLMANELSERLEARLDMDVDMSTLEVGTETIELEDIELASPEGDITVIVERLLVTGDVIALAQREAGSVESVRIEGARLTADLDHPAAAERVAALRRVLGGGSDEASETDDEVGPDETADSALSALGLDRLLAYLQSDAIVEIADARVDLVENGKTQRLLGSTSALVVRRADSAFDLTGNARHAGGTFDWTLKANLDERKVDGLFGWQNIPAYPAARWLPELPVAQLGSTRTSGLGNVSADASGVLTFDGQAEIEGLTLDHPRLSDRPLEDLSGEFEGKVRVTADPPSYEITEARLVRDGVEAALASKGTLDGEHWTFDLQAEMPSTSCQSVIRAIPVSLVGTLAKTEMSGVMQADFSLQIDSAKPKATELEIDIDDGCDFESTPALGSPDRFRQPFRQATRGHDGEIVHTFETGPGSEWWTPIEEVSPFLIQAILAHEDAGFFRHSGFAVYAMESAIGRNLSRKRAAFGASTLSMQLAKNLFFGRDKTLARKAREAIATWWLEHHFDKRELLELYVNIVELGPEIFGVRQAAAHYFDRHPLDLTPAESVFLSTLLPAPVPRSQQYAEGGLWSGTEQEIGWLLRHMHRKGRIDSVALDHGTRQLEQFRFAYRDERGQHGGEVRPAAYEDLGQPGDLPFETRYVRRQAPEVQTDYRTDGELMIDEAFLAQNG